MSNYTTAKAISIHALHREGDEAHKRLHLDDVISIHALHREGDLNKNGDLLDTINISIHALHREGDCISQQHQKMLDLFQSTPSTGRATMTMFDSVENLSHFNPRPPQGGRRTCE